MANARHRRLARLHGWAGLALALPLLLIALSGALLLFKDVLFVPDGWRVPPPAQAESDRELARLLAHPALAQAESLRPARGERGFHAVGLPDGLLSYWRSGADGPDPQPPLRLRLEHDVLELHEHLLLGGVGDTLVRTLGPLVAVLLVVGLVLWWPLRRGWRARDLVLRGAAGRPQLLRAHLALGAAAGLLFLTHAATGAMMANNPAIRDWLKPLSDPRATQLPADASSSFAAGDAAAALASLRSLFPAGEIVQANRVAPAAPGATWSLRMRLPGEDHPNGRSNVTLDLAGGRIVSVRDARLAGIPGVYDDVVFPLHVGTLFGEWQRALWLLGAIGLGRLVVLGVVAFLRRSAGAGTR